jgi:hypothetical protein
MRAKPRNLVLWAAALLAAGCSSSSESGTAMGSTPSVIPGFPDTTGFGTATPRQYTGDQDALFCQTTDEACALYCAEGERCGVWVSGPACLMSCRSQEIFSVHSNLAHSCVKEEGCDFFADTGPCIGRKQAASSYECSGDSITICDQEGCCLLRTCTDACRARGLRSAGCGFSEDRQHDACRCEAE